MRELRVTIQEAERSSYPIFLGFGLDAIFARWLRDHGSWSTVALISDDLVAGVHAHRWQAILGAAGLDVVTLTFPAGEASKTRGTKARLEDQLLAAGLGRDSLIVALGGGVTLDLAGFVAATYMRGLPFVSLPTTTLAMVDSAIGGKTGVDTDRGKNLIGAFHPPQAVFADISHLETLPEPVYLAGFAEAVKHGLIASASHFEALEHAVAALLARDRETLESILEASMAIKVGFVEKDQRESNARKALNFGHTFGHALERLSGWQLSHGEAVARGLLAECRISRHLKLFSHADEKRLQKLLARFKFVQEPFDRLQPELTPEPRGGLALGDYLQATSSDKKAREGKVEYVLLATIGEVARGGEDGDSWTRPVADDTIREALWQT